MPVVESALGAASKIGPYFTAVSLIPAAGLTYVTYVLIFARPWSGTPHWAEAGQAATDVSVSGFLVAALITVILAMVLHPLQFALVQFLEGYWGTHRVAIWAASKRLRAHSEAKNRMGAIVMDGRDDFEEVLKGHAPTSDDLPAWWFVQETDRVRAVYPDLFADVMPTRLGNILRRYEARAGRPYGLNAINVIPHLALVAPPEHVAYMQDQRTQLDLATRMCLVMMILTSVVALLFLPTGFWILIAVIPYTLAYLFYRGACTVAHHYGNAFETLLDLNRHAMYEALHLALPSDLHREQRQNEALTRVIAERRADTYLKFRHQDPPTPRPS